MADALILLILAAYAVSGFRRGLVRSSLSLAGLVAGAVVGMRVVPSLVDLSSTLAHNAAARVGVTVFGVIMVSVVGQAIGLWAGDHVHAQLRAPLARGVDSALGTLAVAAAAAVLVWFAGGALRVAGPAPVSQALARSTVLARIDDSMPSPLVRAFSGVRRVLAMGGFPQVFDGTRSEPIAPVDGPDTAVAKGRGVRAAAASVVKITAVATDCHQIQEGSGWVFERGLVLTNAHVVAGTRAVEVAVAGESVRGRVVVFDPQRDLAVVQAVGLRAAPLPLGGSLARGDGAAIAGYPDGGSYAVRAARIRGQITAIGADIYGKPGIVREVYSLRASVHPGNSGGPLLDPSGRVDGIVFARSLDDENTGYALTLTEVAPILDDGRLATRAVSTGGCVYS